MSICCTLAPLVYYHESEIAEKRRAQKRGEAKRSVREEKQEVREKKKGSRREAEGKRAKKHQIQKRREEKRREAKPLFPSVFVHCKCVNLFRIPTQAKIRARYFFVCVPETQRSNSEQTSASEFSRTLTFLLFSSVTKTKLLL